MKWSRASGVDALVREDTALDKARQLQTEALKKYKQEVEKLSAQTESDRALLQVPAAGGPHFAAALHVSHGACACRRLCLAAGTHPAEGRA